MRARTSLLLSVGIVLLIVAFAVVTRTAAQRPVASAARPGSFDEVVEQASNQLFRNGKQIFRFDTFGDERFWSGALKLNHAIAGGRLGGVGGGVGPAAALAAGLKVDVEMVPHAILDGIKSGAVDLSDPNVGAIVAMSPDLSAIANLLQVDQATVRKVMTSWGPGRFDAQLFLDGKAFCPDGQTAATLIPPAFGLAGINMHTSTG